MNNIQSTKKTPQIRFKGFSEEWTQKKYAETFDTSVSNNTLSRAELTTEKTSTRNVHYGDILIKYNSILNVKSEDMPYIPEDVKIDSKNLLKNGDIIFADTAEDETCGKATEINNIDNEKLVAGLHTFVARPKTKFEEQYLGYFINSPAYHNQLLPFMQGTKVTSISKTSIQKTWINYPDSTEQIKIGTLFSQIDSLIASTQKEHDKLVTLKKCMLQKMFPKKGSLVPEIRFKGFSGDWEEKKLSEIAIYKNGQGHEENQTDIGKYELVNLNSISIDGGLKPSGKFINDENDTLLKNDLVMVLSDVGHGDLLGRVAIIPENNRFVLNQRVALLRIIDDTNPYFLFSIINGHQKYFKKLGAGSSQLNISRGVVENFIVQFPCVEEQNKIADYFTKLDKLIANQIIELEKLKNVKKTLLGKMFV